MVSSTAIPLTIFRIRMLIFLFCPLVSLRSPRARQWGTSPRPFLIKADQIASGVAEGGNPARTPWEIGARRLDDDAAVGGSLSQGGIDVVDPDRGEQAGVPGDFSTGDPCAAHVSRGVIEARARCVSVPDIPAEYFFIEGNRLGDVDSRNLEVTQARAT